MCTSGGSASKVLAAILLLGCAPLGLGAEDNGHVRQNHAAAAYVPGRILVIWKTSAETNKETKLAALAKMSGSSIAASRQITPRMQLLRLANGTSSASASMLANLRADPRVKYADYDYRKFPLALPNDADFSNQWYLQAVQPSALRAQDAWDITQGSTGIIVADVDTGIRYDHPDIARATAAGKMLPGYDFVDADFGGTFLAANDGNARDADASDPGDWITSAESQSGPFQGCQSGPSSWHGTRTAGLIGALTNNGMGIAGVNWNAYIVPVRVMGKCGGFDSDIIDGVRWAAGLPVTGAPVNPYPARVINLSLGGAGGCTQPYIDMFSELTAASVTVVVSAGNDGGPVAIPANCPGAVAVAGLRHIGTKVGFSNLGPEITVSAPGGNCVNTSGGPCLFSIDTLTDVGTTTPQGPGYTDMTNFNVGTSFSAPLVSGVASLMLAEDQNLQPVHIMKRLRLGATKPFPVNLTPDPNTGPIPTCHVPNGFGDIQDSECNCTVTTCGGGMLNAAGALVEARKPIASVALPATVAAGGNVSLTGSRSVASCGRTIASYDWSVLLGAAVIANPAAADTSVVAPSGTDVYVLRLTVTDDQGDTDATDITITPTSASSNAPTITPVDPCPTPITIAQVPLPTATLSANPTSVRTGHTTTLTWSSTGATSCTATGAWSGVKAASGTETSDVLTANGTFTIACDGAGGTSNLKSVSVTVTAAPTSSSGGGGLFGAWSLFGLATLLAASRRRVLR